MNDSNNRLFLGLTALFGTAAAVLRVLLLKYGLDEKGLLIESNPCNLALWAVCGVFVVLVYLLLGKRLGGNGSFEDSFPPCRLRFALSAVAGVLLAVENLRRLGAGDVLPGVLGLLAAVGILAGAVCRLKDIRPLPLFHIGVCVYFIVRLVLSFQGWSADPQFQDYSMQLLACVSLMLFAFHRASFDADLPNRKATALCSLYAAFFCLASLSDATMPLLYLAGGLWAIGAGPTLRPLEKDEED